MIDFSREPVTPLEAENLALALARGLQVAAPVLWRDLLAVAQTVLLTTDDVRISNDEAASILQHDLSLTAAARILASATNGQQLPAPTRADVAVFGAVANAMAGNFASATVLLAQAIGSTANDLLTGPLIAVVAPRLRERAVEFPGNTRADVAFLQLLNAYLVTGDSALHDGLRDRYTECLRERAPTVQGGLLRYARLALEQILVLSIAEYLQEHGEAFPAGYRQRLVDDGVLLFLPPQYLAVRTRSLPLRVDNGLVTLPTSTGKTLVGELCLVAALHRSPGIAIYVSPWVAAARQAARSIRKHVPEEIPVHEMVGGVLGGVSLGDAESEIVVATPERLDSLLRYTPAIFHRLRAVVVDEAHLVENGARGTRLEGLMARMRLRQREGAAFRLVALSAVLADEGAVRSWLDVSEEAFVSDWWAPTARRLAVWNTDGRLGWYNGGDPVRPEGTNSTRGLGIRRAPWPDQRVFPVGDYARMRALRPRVNQAAAYLYTLLREEMAGAFLFVCGSRSDSRSVAQAIAERLPEKDLLGVHADRAVGIIASRYPYLTPLANLLRRGVAFHNSAVPHEVRRLIELGVEAGELSCVAATTTLAEGVDLPFRVTVIVDWLTWDEGKQHPLPTRLFRNIAGRCGRANAFTEGDTIIIDNPLGDLQYTGPEVRRAVQRAAFFSDTPPGLTSTLEPAELSDDVRAAFAAQVLAAIPENPDNDELAEAIGRNLYASHDNPVDADNVLRVTRATVEDLLDVSRGALARAASPLRLTEFGRAANQTGFSPQSARTLAGVLRNWKVPTDAGLVGAHLLGRCAAFPEQSSSRFRKAIAGKQSKLYVRESDLPGLLEDVLAGESAETMFVRLPKVRGSSIKPKVVLWLTGDPAARTWTEYFEYFTEFLRGVVGEYLPWLLRASEVLEQYLGSDSAATWDEWATAFENSKTLDRGEEEPS